MEHCGAEGGTGQSHLLHGLCPAVFMGYLDSGNVAHDVMGVGGCLTQEGFREPLHIKG